MADFTRSFWSIFITVGTLGGILFCFILIWRNMAANTEAKQGKAVEAMEHVWDEDLQELNSPLPSWWLYMFYITLIFGIVYLILYPGLGTYKGVLGWSSHGSQYEGEMKAAAEKYNPIYEKYGKENLVALSENKEAMKTGHRIYQNYCTVCHGSDARGSRGFPNLTDNDWLWGGSPEQIQTTIANGRKAAMPAWGAVLKGDDLNNVAEYVLSLSGRSTDAAAAEKGGEKYKTLCVACHGPEGKGNPALGSANLTDRIWLYGGSKNAIEQTIEKGRNGLMPAHKDFLGEDKVHLLAAYVYSLSAQK